MKYLYLLLFVLGLQAGFAQSTTVSVFATGGLSSFSGAGSSKNTEFWTGGYWCMCDTREANSFGARSAISYGGGLTLQHLFQNKMIAGLDLGYEMLRSRSRITQIALDDMVFRTKGRNISSNHFINAFPHAGYLFPISNKIDFSASGGADIGFGLSSREKMKIPDFGDMPGRSTDKIPGIDFRPRIQIGVTYEKFTFTGSYARGIKNWGSSDLDARLNVIRFGVQYRLIRKTIL